MFKAGPNKNGVLQAHLETSSGRVQMTVKVDSMTHFCRVLSYFKIQMLDGQHKLRRQPYLNRRIGLCRRNLTHHLQPPALKTLQSRNA